MESSRTSLASRTHFEVLGLEGQVLGLEASSPRKLACPRLEDSSNFWIVKILWNAWKIFWNTFFCGNRLKKFCEDLFYFLESTCACVLGPWPRAFLSLASRVSVLGKTVLGLGLGFFCVLGLGLEPCVLDSTYVKKCNVRQKYLCFATNFWSVQNPLPWLRRIFVQQLVASNFVKNGKNFKRKLCLNVIISFSVIAWCLNFCWNVYPFV